MVAKMSISAQQSSLLLLNELRANFTGTSESTILSNHSLPTNSTTICSTLQTTTVTHVAFFS